MSNESSKAKILLLGSCHSTFFLLRIALRAPVIRWLLWETWTILTETYRAGTYFTESFGALSLNTIPLPHFTDWLLPGMQVTIENILNLLYI